jgi:uncharacterized protein
MSLKMVDDETLAIECPDIVFSDGFALNIPALISLLDRHYCTIGGVNALNHGASHRHKPATTDWTDHLSSPLKVRKILLNSIILCISARSRNIFKPCNRNIMDPLSIINNYFEPGSTAFNILIEHSSMVMAKALAVAENVRHLSPDLTFIREAAMLHDIGIVFVNAPQLGCHGDRPYICHGHLGREILEKEGFPLHALVCERHIGAGLGIADIVTQNLPLPLRNMSPLSVEEKIICYADKFYSKKMGLLRYEKSGDQARGELEKFGAEKLEVFDDMHRLFSKRPVQEKDRQQEP